MFNEFTSSDRHKREAVRNRRLMMMRCARLAGYYDEEGSEGVVLASSQKRLNEAHADGEWDGSGIAVVFDGVNPCDSPLTPSLNLTQVVEQAQSETDDQIKRARDAAARVCKKCAGFGWVASGGNESIFGTAQCPECDGTGFNKPEPA